MTLVAVRNRGAELWAYDADKDTWSIVTMAGQPPGGSTDFDVLVYDPPRRQFLFLNVVGVQSGARADGIYTFRFRRSGKE